MKLKGVFYEDSVAVVTVSVDVLILKDQETEQQILLTKKELKKLLRFLKKEKKKHETI